MGSLIFVPGILGSKLTLQGEVIWPPSLSEIVGGYSRINKLLDDAVVAGEPISNVCLRPIYAPLIEDLSMIASGQAGAAIKSFHKFGYDWRKDLRETAITIAEKIDNLSESDRESIDFVCHSMGNLVVRLILEGSDHQHRKWLKNVRTLVSLAGPHRGSPTALVRALGLEGTTGLSGANIKSMASDPRYPSLYQLLPPPGQVVAWNVKGGSLQAMDIFQEGFHSGVGLSAENLKVSAETHEILSSNGKPADINYVYLAGTAEDTWVRVETSVGQPRPISGRDSGDGTVPLWSAVDPSQPYHVAPGTHSELFRNDQIRSVMYQALGARMPGVSFVSDNGSPKLAIFANELVYAPNAKIDLLLLFSQPLTTIDGVILVEYTPDPTSTAFSVVETLVTKYSGPTLDRMKVSLGPYASGFYRVSFAGSHEATGDDMANFSVSPFGGVLGAGK